MDAAQEVDISEWAMIARVSEEMALMWTFAVAVARSHLDANELLAAFERTLGKDESDDIPSSGLTENLQARTMRYFLRDMLLRVIHSRL